MKKGKSKLVKDVHKMVGRLDCKPGRVINPKKKYNRKKKKDWREDEIQQAL